MQPDRTTGHRTSSSYHVLHAFGRHYPAHGGANPSSGLLDLDGTLYGATDQGGYKNNGVIYGITTTGKKTVVYRFHGAASGDGSAPSQDLTNINGTLYGTTFFGGTCGAGTVYSVTTTGTEKILHSFCGDYVNSNGGLVNVNGTLYGTTRSGSTGQVYSISTSGTYNGIYTFRGYYYGDGFGPVGRLLNVKNVLYGTTLYGGTACESSGGCGTVFSVTTSGKEKVLYSFQGGRSDGSFPTSGVIDVNGTLYGTTYFGGQPGCRFGCGIIYSVSRNGTEKVLYEFSGGSDGGNPDASLLELNGTLYGTTAHGGSDGDGTIFSLNTSGGEQYCIASSAPMVRTRRPI